MGLIGFFKKFGLKGGFDKYRVNDAYYNGDYTGALVAHYLTGTAAFVEHEDSVSDTSLSGIERDKISAIIVFIKIKWLYNKQPAMLVIRVADGGNYSSNYFSNDHSFM